MIYKIYFTGYHLVEADSEEEAVSKAVDGDWCEEYLDHDDRPEEVGEVAT